MLNSIETLDIDTSEQINWSESFELYGERRPRLPRDADLSELYNWALFKAKCKLCGTFTEESDSNTNVKRLHLEHCSRSHGYVFDESCVFQVDDSTLQEIITKSSEYKLPMPGFDDHYGCIKKFIGKTVVCAVHKGNERKQKYSMRYA